MSLASAPTGLLPLSAQDAPTVTSTKPSRRTSTARADVVNDPEAR